MLKPFLNKPTQLLSKAHLQSSLPLQRLTQLWPKARRTTLSPSQQLSPMTSKAPTVSNQDGTSSTSLTLTKVVPSLISLSNLTPMTSLVLLRTFQIGLWITEPLTSPATTTVKLPKTSQLTRTADPLLFACWFITLVISINLFTLWLKSIRLTHQATKEEMLKQFQASAVLLIYTLFGTL